ncbi:uncharacterized protein [Littorina saxatilis]|uniref:uncharacterized protein n=1 Tax=Littorina saxatilis TaxID=31220 RepID=UPI0038B4EF07
MQESSPPTSRSSNDDVTTESTTQALDSLYNVNEFLNQKNAENLSHLIPTIVFIVVLMIVGIVGNSVVFTVYYKRFKPSVTRTYILAMNVCAFLINVVSIPLKLVEICMQNTFDSEWGCKTSRILRHFLITFSTFILVAVSVDRYNVMCSVRHSLQYSLERAYVYMLLCAVVSLILSVPYGVITGNTKTIFADSNITGVGCGSSDEYKGSTTASVYDVTIGIVYVLCVVTMSVSYGRIVLHLWRHQKLITARGITQRKVTWSDYLRSVTSDKIWSRNAEAFSSGRPLLNKANHDSTSVNKEQAIPISETDITTSLSQAEKTFCHVEEPRSVLQTANEEQAIPISETDITTSLSQAEKTFCHVEEPRSVLQTANEEQAIPISETDITTSLSQAEKTFCHVEEPRSVLQTANEEQAIPISETDITTSLSQAEKTVCHVEEPSSTRLSLKQAKPNDEAVNEEQEIPCSATDICTSLSQPEPTLCHVEEFRLTVHLAVNEEQASVSDITTALPQFEHSFNQQVTIQSTEVRRHVRSIPSRTTFMMVVLTVLFVLNYIPYLYIKNIYDKVISNEILTRDNNPNWRMIALHSVYVNSAVSPLVFSFCSNRFRYEFCNLFRGKNM